MFLPLGARAVAPATVSNLATILGYLRIISSHIQPCQTAIPRPKPLTYAEVFAMIIGQFAEIFWGVETRLR
jgi:hypothetical protein